MAKVVASLSEQAWITDSAMILNNLMSYYILTDSAQSVMFQDKLINLPFTYYKFISDPVGMNAAVKTDLDTLLSRYFPVVDVTTEVKQLTNTRFGILLYASVIDEESNRIELAKVTEISTTGLRKVIEVSNNGDGRAYLGSMV